MKKHAGITVIELEPDEDMERFALHCQLAHIVIRNGVVLKNRSGGVNWDGYEGVMYRPEDLDRMGGKHRPSAKARE